MDISMIKSGKIFQKIVGQQQPSLMTIFKLANGLQCSASELIQHTEEIHRDVGQ